MILSEGKNRFENNTFSFWGWSAPVLQTPEEVIRKVHELHLVGRTVKDIAAVGMGYNWNDYGIDEAVYHALEKLDDDAKKSIKDREAFVPHGLDLLCWAEIDEPLLIEFEDGDVLAIDFSEGSCVRMGLNEIGLTAEPGTNRKTFHADRLFRDVIGRKIVDVEISSAIESPGFTGSHGLVLDEQPSYISKLELVYDNESHIHPRRRLSFEPWLDYGEVCIVDHSGQTLTVPSESVPWIVEGYIAPEEFALSAEKAWKRVWKKFLGLN